MMHTTWKYAKNDDGQVAKLGTVWETVPEDSVHPDVETRGLVDDRQPPQGHVWAKTSEQHPPDGYKIDGRLSEGSFEASEKMQAQTQKENLAKHRKAFEKQHRAEVAAFDKLAATVLDDDEAAALKRRLFGVV